MKEIWKAVAEAIQEAEDQAAAEDPTQHVAHVTSIMEEATSPEAYAPRAETSITTTPPVANQEQGEPMIGRAP